jgi:hypothetical protein
MDDRTADPHEGNVRICYVVVTPVCKIFVLTTYITLITATLRWNRAISNHLSEEKSKGGVSDHSINGGTTHPLVALFVSGAQ